MGFEDPVSMDRDGCARLSRIRREQNSRARGFGLGHRSFRDGTNPEHHGILGGSQLNDNAVSCNSEAMGNQVMSIVSCVKKTSASVWSLDSGSTKEASTHGRQSTSHFHLRPLPSLLSLFTKSALLQPPRNSCYEQVQLQVSSLMAGLLTSLPLLIRPRDDAVSKPQHFYAGGQEYI